MLVHFTHAVAKGFLSAAWQSDYGRDFERPRNNSQTVRFYYPFENSHRFTSSYEVPDVAGFRQIAFTGFLGTYEQRTDQDRFATATTGRSIERADVSANDFHVKGSAERVLGSARVEFGVDVNGRYGLEALDIIQAYDLGGAMTRDTTNVSVDDARRIDTGLYVQAESAVGGFARISAGIRGDRVTTKNVGGFFGDRSTSNAAASGFGAVTVGPFQGFSVTGSGVARLPGSRPVRPLLPRAIGSRLHHRQPGSGAGDQPAVRPRDPIHHGADAVGVFVYQYRITDLIERYQTQTDFFFFRNRGRARLRGFEVEARSDARDGYSVEIAAQIARGRALDDNANLDDISPATFSVLGRKEFAVAGMRRRASHFYAEDDRPGPSEIAAPGATLLDLGAGWRLLPQLELRGLLRNLARR